MTSLAFILRYPWGLYDNSNRSPLLVEGNHASANWPFLLATTSDASVRLGNRRVPPQPESFPFEWGKHTLRFYSIPAVTKNERKNLSILLADSRNNLATYPIQISDSVARPKDSSNGASQHEDSDSGNLTALIKTMFHRMDDIIKSAMEEDSGKKILRLSWEKVADRVLEDTEEFNEPFMDLIVRHANDLHKTVLSTAERPRRVLNRVRRMMSVTKIQELDSACLTDYVRRPGVTPAQKAGPRQELLGIDRTETYDTVENRVLKDFLKRSHSASQTYLRAFSKFRSSSRYTMVQQYGLACRRLFRESVFENVSGLDTRPNANYVLLFDPSYHKIWIAYQELLAQDQQEDDAWRWQARLWSDICVVMLHASLLWLAPPSTGVASISPLYIRLEQSRGRWTEETPQSAFFVFEVNGRRVVAAPLDTRTREKHPQIMDWQISLGVSTTIYLEEIGTGRKAYILVWALHSTGKSQPDLDEAILSAEDCLSVCRDHVRTYHDMDINVRGLVLQSSREIDARPCSEKLGLVSGVCFAPSNNRTPQAIEIMGSMIRDFIGELFR